MTEQDLIEQLYDLCDEYMYDIFGDFFDIREYCYLCGFYSHEDVVDADGNVVESNTVIARKDLQNACNDAGIEIDVMNY